ncbi:uncharacterized protein LOC121530217 [Drosophila eugracilis]|uniref:uncharacterized protein LOC121530217 n=1 Tax=Drosophila eugracilis TaxID=29029 RepID=UPI001BDADDAC|nr:uncharacterized protein LOC121530217 [Drosophila eugracilis]
MGFLPPTKMTTRVEAKSQITGAQMHEQKRRNAQVKAMRKAMAMAKQRQRQRRVPSKIYKNQSKHWKQKESLTV